MCSVDLPANAIVLDTKQFNGKHGCSYCEDEGVARSTTHLHRNWSYSSSSRARTHGSIIANAREAIRNGEPVSSFTCVFKFCKYPQSVIFHRKRE